IAPFRAAGVLDDLAGRLSVHGRAGTVDLADEHVAERACVPLALDRDAVRPAQLVRQSGGHRALEAQGQLETIALLVEAVRLGHADGWIADRGRESHLLALCRFLLAEGDGLDRPDGAALVVAGHLPEDGVERDLQAGFLGRLAVLIPFRWGFGG